MLTIPELGCERWLVSPNGITLSDIATEDSLQGISALPSVGSFKDVCCRSACMSVDVVVASVCLRRSSSHIPLCSVFSRPVGVLSPIVRLCHDEIEFLSKEVSYCVWDV